jgi:hypothetical protein
MLTRKIATFNKQVPKRTGSPATGKQTGPRLAGLSAIDCRIIDMDNWRLTLSVLVVAIAQTHTNIFDAQLVHPRRPPAPVALSTQRPCLSTMSSAPLFDHNVALAPPLDALAGC